MKNQAMNRVTRTSLRMAAAVALPAAFGSVAFADDVPDLDPNALAIVGGALDQHDSGAALAVVDRGQPLPKQCVADCGSDPEVAALWNPVGEVGDAMAINDAMALEGDQGRLIEVIFVTPQPIGRTTRADLESDRPAEDIS